MPIVKCNVANCSFWGEGNNCQADSILVEIDEHADNHADIDESGNLSNSTAHEDAAEHSAETCCHTFKPKH
jgi:hypothetical protein